MTKRRLSRPHMMTVASHMDHPWAYPLSLEEKIQVAKPAACAFANATMLANRKIPSIIFKNTDIGSESSRCYPA